MNCYSCRNTCLSVCLSLSSNHFHSQALGKQTYTITHNYTNALWCTYNNVHGIQKQCYKHMPVHRILTFR